MKRAFKFLAIGVVLLVALGLIVNGVLAWRAQQQLESMIAALRVAGDPASLAELAYGPIPPGQNGATYLRAMVPELDEFEKKYFAFYQTPLGKQWAEREGREPPTAEQAAAMNAILEAFPTILPKLEQGANCAEYGSLLDFELPPNEFLEMMLERPSDLRKLARFVGWKMNTLMAAGENDAAVRLGTQTLRFTKLYDQEPLLVNQLVAIAVRALAIDRLNQALREGQISPLARALLDEELGIQDSGDPLAQSLRSERGFAISHVQQQADSIGRFLGWPVLHWGLREIQAESAAYELAKRGIGLTQPQSGPPPYKLWPKELDEAMQGATIREAIEAVAIANVRSRTQIRCLRILNALGAYRDQTGQETNSLDRLDLPPEEVVDLYSGKPLMMKKTDQGWIVYSVGPNGVDDGARDNLQDGDWGVFPPGTPQAKDDGPVDDGQ